MAGWKDIIRRQLGWLTVAASTGPVVGPDQPTIDFHYPASELDYRSPASRLHYTYPASELHYISRE